MHQFSWQITRTQQISQRKATCVMLKRDTRRHTAKAMLKQSGCYSNTLTYCMYAEDITLQAVARIDSPLPR